MKPRQRLSARYRSGPAARARLLANRHARKASTIRKKLRQLLRLLGAVFGAMESPGLALAAGVVAGAVGAACIIHWQQKKEKQLVRRSSSEKVQCNEFATTPSALLPTMQRVSTVIRDELPEQQVDRKIVYLVRHAQAAHNILEAAAKKAVKARGGSDAEAEEARKAVLDNPDNFDAALSVKGQSQASASGVELAELFQRTHYPPPECVLVSPLQRTLHTATLLFPDHPKMSAHERLREKRTGKPCDERRPAAEAARQFPHISFDTIAKLDARSDDGHKFRPEFLEGNAQVEKRAATLLDLLRSRKEKSIAVVAHKGYLRELYKGTLARLKVGRCSGAPALHRAVTEALDAALDDNVGSHALKLQLDPIFGNAEVRVLQVAFPRDSSQPPAISLKLLGERRRPCFPCASTARRRGDGVPRHAITATSHDRR